LFCPNTTATVYLPARDGGEITEGGVPAAESDGVREVGREGDRAVFKIESGSYAFTSQM
jgi:hypothetical protein